MVKSLWSRRTSCRISSLIFGIFVYPGKDRGEVKIKVEGSVPDILEFAARQRGHGQGAKGERKPNRSVVLVVPRGGLPQVNSINGLSCQTCSQGRFDLLRLFGVVSNLARALRQGPAVTGRGRSKAPAIRPMQKRYKIVREL